MGNGISVPAPPERLKDLGFFLVGPVVGWVDDKTARVLVETSVDADVTATVMKGTTPQQSHRRNHLRRRYDRYHEGQEPVAETGKVVCKQTKHFHARSPAPFQFTQLEPGQIYIVKIKGETANSSKDTVMKGETTASFTTIDPTRTKLRIGFVSCNNKNYYERSKMWHRLRARVSTRHEDNHPGMDMLVHMGDQVYCDGEMHLMKSAKNKEQRDEVLAGSCWGQCLERLKGIPREEWGQHRHALVEMFRDVYRETWNHPDCRAVLASVPNIMVLDDHDIRDDYGDRPEDADPTTVDGFLGTCGLQCYYEYQMQLLRDVDMSNFLREKAYSIQTVGPSIGLILMDLRIERSLKKSLTQQKGEAEGGPPDSSGVYISSAADVSEDDKRRQEKNMVCCQQQQQHQHQQQTEGDGQMARVADEQDGTPQHEQQQREPQPLANVDGGSYNDLLRERDGNKYKDEEIKMEQGFPGGGEGAGREKRPEWKDKTYLGPTQHADIDQALEGKLKDVKQLFLVSPTPPLLFSSHLTTKVGSTWDYADDLLGQWCAESFVKERDNLMKQMADWAAKSPKRSVVIVAGDIHLGGYSKAKVLHEQSGNHFMIHQMVSSAVSNEFGPKESQLKQKLGTWFLKANAALAQRAHDLKIYHSRYHITNNAGIIDVELNESGRPKAEGHLLVGNHARDYNKGLTMTMAKADKLKKVMCGCVPIGGHADQRHQAQSQQAQTQ